MAGSFSQMRERPATPVFLLGLLIATNLCASGRLFAGQPPQADHVFKRLNPSSEKNVTTRTLRIHASRESFLELDRAALKHELSRAPREKRTKRLAEGVELVLPLPNGKSRRFKLVESPVMAPGLAAKYPEIKTYVGVGVDNPTDTVRLDLTPAGMHAQMLSPDGAVYVDPADASGNLHVAYYAKDALRSEGDFECLAEPVASSTVSAASLPAGSGASDGLLRTYRLAVAATGEYTQFYGGTKAGALAAIVTAVNRLNGIYESELAVRFLLVESNDSIIYTNSLMDPYSNDDGVAMLSENQLNLDAVIGPANYDVGHVFSTGGGGIAQIGSACVAGAKARGVTGRASPVGDAFYVDYVAHELGHQFGAHHTFNGSAGGCGNNNRYAPTAYEPGSGSTIMGYAGICGSDDLQLHSDPYFHSASLAEIASFIQTTGVAAEAAGNSVPSVSAGAGFVIPASTPFTLTASGTNADGDDLTFCWEEMDLGAAASLSSGDDGSGPLFRSFAPTNDPSRTFPNLASLLAGQISAGELLPTTSRTMTFRVTARDNHPGSGATAMDEMQVGVVAEAGPFRVTSPAGAVTWSGTNLVVWDVAGSDAAPVSAALVDILLSTNGGLSFPITLTANTANDGSELVALPDIFTEQARIKVQASSSIFFDVSDGNFTILPQGATEPVVVTETHSFTNATGLALPTLGTKGSANPFPSQIEVAGVEGQIANVSVELRGLTHSFLEDLDVLLVGPGGETVMVLSDAGNAQGVTDVDLTFKDEGADLASVSPIESGSYAPINVGSAGDSFPVAGPYGTSLAVFNGLEANGVWSLYLYDDSTGDSGMLAGGWALQIQTRRPVWYTNEPPIIRVKPDRFVHEGALLVVAAEAYDPDGPQAGLVYSAETGIPDGATLDAETGVLQWRPSSADVGSTNLIGVRVTDSGAPALSAVSEFNVVVVPRPTIQSLQITNGMACLRWSSVPEAHYQLQCSDDLVSGNWMDVAASCASGGMVTEAGDPLGESTQRFYRVRVSD